MSADFSAMFAAKAKAKAAPPPVAPTRELPNDGSSSKKKKKKKKKRNVQEAGLQPAQPAASSASTGGASGRDNKRAKKMSDQLAGAQFRYINETLYTRPSEEAVSLFNEEPKLFEAYHEGFRLQAARWPLRPVQAIATWLRTQPKEWVIADLGCGDAELATTVTQKVHSFDLVAVNNSVVACDIAHVPLASASVHVAVFCLALMGSNYAAFLQEAHRLLKPKGVLKIAEVTSRIGDPDGWAKLLHALGFDLQEHDTSNTHFVMFKYLKSDRTPDFELPTTELKPCIYKRR